MTTTNNGKRFLLLATLAATFAVALSFAIVGV
jgi:hypothetical protein